MSKWGFAVGVAFVLSGACDVQEDQFPDAMCPETITSCRVVSGWGGYQRSCSTSCTQQSVQSNRGKSSGEDADDSKPGKNSSPTVAGAKESDDDASSDDNLGVATPLDLTRHSAFDIPCERDSQCGPGKCKEGNCYYGCHSDAQCGSGDRCAVESGVRVCQPDPNPPVDCTRSAQCDDGFTCLNGACRQTCASTEQCTNLLDRCGSGVCLPDRRPLGECVLNTECSDGLVCLDGACVPACPGGDEAADAGICLAEPAPAAPSSEPTPSLPPGAEPQTPDDEEAVNDSDGTEETSSDDTADTASDDEADEAGDDEDDGDDETEDTGEPPSEPGPDAGVTIPIIR